MHGCNIIIDIMKIKMLFLSPTISHNDDELIYCYLILFSIQCAPTILSAVMLVLVRANVRKDSCLLTVVTVILKVASSESMANAPVS